MECSLRGMTYQDQAKSISPPRADGGEMRQATLAVGAARCGQGLGAGSARKGRVGKSYDPSDPEDRVYGCVMVHWNGCASLNDNARMVLNRAPEK